LFEHFSDDLIASFAFYADIGKNIIKVCYIHMKTLFAFPMFAIFQFLILFKEQLLILFYLFAWLVFVGLPSCSIALFADTSFARLAILCLQACSMTLVATRINYFVWH
jgi:hypothetical protein